MGYLYVCFFSLQIYKAYRHSVFAFTHVLIPAWIIHYYIKYHVNVSMFKVCIFQNLLLILYRIISYAGIIYAALLSGNNLPLITGFELL